MTRWNYDPRSQKKSSYNYKQANKGMFLERLINMDNELYRARGLGNVQKIATPVKILEIKNKKVYGYLESKSTLDFRGSLKFEELPYAVPVSFDAKESQDERGLPLKYISDHQLKFIQEATDIGEISFIITWIHPDHKGYLVTGETILQAHKEWKEHKGERGYNLIPKEKMYPLITKKGYTLSYAETVKSILKNKGYFDKMEK